MARARRVQVRQIPQEVRLQQVAPVAHVLVQVLVLGLIGSDRIGAVRVVIQPLNQADVAFPGQAQRVGQPERDAVAEAAVQRRLDRVIGLAKIREVEPDLAEAAIRPQQVGRIGGGAGRAARRRASGSWFCGRNAAPRSTALMSTCVCPRISRSWLNPCCPTYETSMVDAHGSVICTPAFHCVDDGMSASYGQTDVNCGGPRISRPDASSCSSA